MKLSSLSWIGICVILLAGADAHGHGVSRHDILRGRYFVVVGAYQSQDNDVTKAHTFASFYNGDDLAHPATISWLPTTGVVNPFGTTRGRNFSLAQTLSMACRSGREVKWWGPYEIRAELYQSALRRIALLGSGRIAYSMMGIDRGAMNCIDAAGDLTGAPLDTGMMWGFEATSAVVRHLSPSFLSNGRAVRELARHSIWRTCQRPETSPSQTFASKVAQ